MIPIMKKSPPISTKNSGHKVHTAAALLCLIKNDTYTALLRLNNSVGNQGTSTRFLSIGGRVKALTKAIIQKIDDKRNVK